MAHGRSGERNPFRPGDAPLVLAGRHLIRDEIEEWVRTIGLTWRPIILEGPRGVGKTSLIDWASAPIGEAGLVHVQLEARRGASLFDLLTRWSIAHRPIVEELGLTPRAGAGTDVELSAGPVKVRRSARRPPVEPPTSDLEFIARLVDALADRGGGVVISVDEAQIGGSRLVQDIGSLLTSARTAGWRVHFLLAGLHSLRRAIAPNKRNEGSLGQLERAAWFAVAPRLSEDETTFAITESLEIAAPGWAMSVAAAREVFALTAGYPYAVQLLGAVLWDAQPDPHGISVAEVRAARPAFTEQLASSLFDSRWRQMPGAERQYVAVLAELMGGGGPVTNADVARRLGKQPNETTYLRERLLDDGIIVTGDPTRTTEFITPLLAEYVLARSAE